MASLASQLAYGTVTDTFFVATGDLDLDPDSVPDLVPVEGTATFTPSLPSGTPLVFLGTPAIVVPLPVVGTYPEVEEGEPDPNAGRLTLNDAPYVKLVSTDNPLESVVDWQWTVTFNCTALGVPVRRDPVTFSLPSGATIDLATVTPVPTSSGFAFARGDRGDPGPGVRIRGIITGTGSEVLPAGYGAAEDGWTWRVLSDDGTYDEMWTWVWSDFIGTWVDAGPMISAATIDDSGSSDTTVYSAAKIDSLIAASLAAAQSYTDTVAANDIPDDYIRRQDAVTLTWPLRNAPTNRHVTWIGLDFPPTSTGYALADLDQFEGIDQL